MALLENCEKLSEDTKQHIDIMSNKFTILHKELDKCGTDDKIFELIYFIFAIAHLTLLMKQYDFVIMPYNTNTDLYIITLLFLGKRLLWKISSGPRNGGPLFWDYTYLMFPLLLKLFVDVSFDRFLLIFTPLVVYTFMIKTVSYDRYEAAPCEVMHIVKTWIYHSTEMVWFWAFLPLGVWGNSELYVNSLSLVINCLGIWGNSFSLLSISFLDKRFDELKFQAHYLGYWKKVSEREAYQLRTIKPNSNSNKGAIIEYNGHFYKGMCESNKILAHLKHSGKPGDTPSYLLYFLFYTPEKTYLVLLIFQSVLCLVLISYAAWRTQFLYPTIDSCLSVIVFANMCSKRILIR